MCEGEASSVKALNELPRCVQNPSRSAFTTIFSVVSVLQSCSLPNVLKPESAAFAALFCLNYYFKLGTACVQHVGTFVLGFVNSSQESMKRARARVITLPPLNVLDPTLSRILTSSLSADYWATSLVSTCCSSSTIPDVNPRPRTVQPRVCIAVIRFDIVKSVLTVDAVQVELSRSLVGLCGIYLGSNGSISSTGFRVCKLRAQYVS